MKMNAIEIKNVSKRYKDVTALDDVSLSFEYGKIYGFLGRNGAGKIHTDQYHGKQNLC